MHHRLCVSTVDCGIENKTLGTLFFSHSSSPSPYYLNSYGLKNINLFFFFHSDGNQRKKSLC